jgi:exopolysaccharide production protein ExoY
MHDTNHTRMDERSVSADQQYLEIAAGDATLAERHLILAVAERPAVATDPWSEFAGRSLDIALSLAMAVILLPVMLLIAVAIAIADPGPVFFAHRRIGRNGRQFNCYKFRTMSVGAEAILNRLLANSPAFRNEWARGQKLVQDPRVTPLGRLLRTTSLDELPQLFNVVIGDMSIVGPRPIITAELSRYGRHAAEYLAVKPGLTGLWQVTRNEDTSYRRRVATDVLYVRNKSLALDCRILLATIPAVLTGRGSV